MLPLMNDSIDANEEYRQAIQQAIPLARTADERFDLYMAQGDLLLPDKPGLALDAFTAAEGQMPGSAEALAAIAEAHLTAWHLAEARSAATAAISSNPKEARAHYILALLSEQAGEESVAQIHYQHAATADPDLYRLPLQVSEDTFLSLVERYLAVMPPETAAILTHVAIACEDLPSRHKEGNPPPQAFAAIEGETDEALLPPRIVLYRKNLLRAASNPKALFARIALVLKKQAALLLQLAALPPPPRPG